MAQTTVPLRAPWVAPLRSPWRSTGQRSLPLHVQSCCLQICLLREWSWACDPQWDQTLGLSDSVKCLREPGCAPLFHTPLFWLGLPDSSKLLNNTPLEKMEGGDLVMLETHLFRHPLQGDLELLLLFLGFPLPPNAQLSSQPCVVSCGTWFSLCHAPPP